MIKKILIGIKDFLNKKVEFIFIVFCFLSFGYILYNQYNVKEDTYINEVYRKKIELDYYTAKNNLSDSIDKYINTVAPNSLMNGIAFIENADKYDINIFFMLAQCKIESNFATAGLGAKMNSAFNVGAFDNQGTKYMKKYDHPDLSIEPYINLLKTYYLVNDKTEYDLMHKYVTNTGVRYASDKLYEQKLFKTYNELINKYDSLYISYIKLKTLNNL